MNKAFLGAFALFAVGTVGFSLYTRSYAPVVSNGSVLEAPSSTTLVAVGTASSSEGVLEAFIKMMGHELERAGNWVVTSSAGAASSGSLLTICEGSKSTEFDCYELYYSGLVRERGVKEAFADLRARYEQDAYVVAQCHPLTHVIGRIAAGKYKDVAEAYTQGDGFCWSGYYHGVLEGVVGSIGRDQLAGRLNSICASLPGKATYDFDYFNCVHGLGHGVMAFTQTELFEALALCDNLDGSWEQSSCYSGVFMENVIVDNKNHVTKYFKPNEPLYPCNAVDTKYKTSCYLMQTSYMLKVTNGDFVKVFGYCAEAEEGFRAICYQSLGRDASGRSVSNIEVTKATCELGQGFEQQSNCVIGAVKDIISYFHSDVQAKAFCASLSEDLRPICQATEEEYVKGLKL